MEKLVTGIKQVDLKDEHEIKNGFALVIVNEIFKYYKHREGASADRKNIKSFCEKAGFTVNDIKGLSLNRNQIDALEFDCDGHLKTDNLTKAEMENLLKVISQGNFQPYDAFICFISSHGNAGGILGAHGETIPVEYIVDQFKAKNEHCSLVNKPKLFFTQNCRGDWENAGVNLEDDKGETENDDVNDAYETDTEKIPMTIPTTADVLVAYSTVNRYESFRNVKEGSCFIRVLTEVLEKNAKEINLTDMLATVNKEVANMEFNKGNKQMPCFTSTLRKPVRFKMAETHQAIQESSKKTTCPMNL